MSKEKRQIEKQDLLPSDVYAKSRKQIRKDLVEFKKDTGVAALKVLKKKWSRGSRSLSGLLWNALS